MRWMVAAALAGASTMAAAQSGPTIELRPDETLLQVQATGQALVRPDIARFSMGVVSTGATAREATDANSRGIAEVIRALRGAGVEQRDIRTRQISVQPRFQQVRPSTSYAEEQPQIAGYVAQNSVFVTTRDLSKAPDIVAAAFGAGANSVQGPNLALENQADAVAAARADAIAKARFEANAYADGLGMRIARVLRVSERGESSRVDDIVITGSRAFAPPPPPPPSAPVEAGEIMQTLNLWIDFTMVPR